MKILVNTKNMPRDEWLKWRRMGIGGSDAGAICGLNPYRSAINVWMDKTGRAEDEKPDSEAMRVGRDLEDYVARRFMEQESKAVHRINAILQDEDRPFMLANIDRKVVGEKALLECKTASAYNADKWKDGRVPESYEIQCMHYMAVTGFEKVYLACLIMGTGFVVREIRRDEEYINSLCSIEEKFWRNYVETEVMPPPDGSECAGEAIKSLYPQADPETVLDLPESDYGAKLARLDEIVALKKQLEQEEQEIKQSIQVAMEDSETAWIGDRRITWKNVKPRELFDSKRFRKDHPDLYTEYLKTGKPSRRFSISSRKAAEE